MQPNPCFSTNYTSCVFYTGTTYNTTDDGIEICLGKSLNVILETIIDRLLSLDEQCTVKVSSTDECCGYLGEKLVSNTVGTLSITTVTDSETDCQTLNIEIPAPEWEAITFAATYSNLGSESARASVNALGQVELRGRVTGSNVPASGIVTTLGTVFRPEDLRVLSITVNNSGNYYPGIMTISTAGVVTIFTNTSGWTGTTGIFNINGTFWKDA